MIPPPKRSRKPNAEVKKRFETFLSFADANWYHSNMDLKFVERRFGISRRSVSRHFRWRGTSWTEFYLDRKVYEAGKLIREEGTMVKAAIMLVGWPCRSKGWLGRFHRRFKRMHGLLPGEFRRIERGERNDAKNRHSH